LVIAAKLTLRSITMGTPVQIIDIHGDTISRAFEEDKRFDQEALEQAEKFIEEIECDKNKSLRLSKAIEYILGINKKEVKSQTNRSVTFESQKSYNVFLLLGSSIDDLDEVEELCEKHVDQFNSQALRLFPFAVGEQTQEFEVKKLAQIGCGTASIVFSPSQVKEEINNLMRLTRMGSVSKLSIDWGVIKDKNKFESVPKNIPSIVYPGESLIVLSRVSGVVSAVDINDMMIYYNGRKIKLFPEDVTYRHSNTLHHLFRVTQVIDKYGIEGVSTYIIIIMINILII